MASIWRYFSASLSTPFLGEGQRHLVDRRHIFGGNHRPLFEIAEEGNLALDLVGEEAIGAAQQNIRLDSDGEQFLDRVLRGLGLQLLGGADPGNQGDVHEDGIFPAKLLAHLADSFQKGQGFDVAHRAPDLDNGHVGVGRHLAHGILDFIGHVGNHLHRLAQVVAAALLGDDLLVNPAGGQIVVAAQPGMGEALVMTQIEIGFRAVVGHENLAVLERGKRSWVDVEVGVELHQVDAQTAALKQAADRGGSQALA